MFASVAILVFAGIQVQSAFGQAETGLINGTITDQSGASVPKAKVTIRNMGTNAERLLETDTNGFYSVSNLQPGIYLVTAEATNLAKTDARAEVTVGSRVSLNLQLNVGSATTIVEVTGQGGAQVNTETATLGTVIDSEQLSELPTLNRNPYTF